MKSQVSVEFLLLVSLLIAFAGIIILINSGFQESVREEEIERAAHRACEKISFEINNAVRFGDGYKRRFYLEEKIAGLDYTLNLENYAIIIEFDGKRIECKTLAKEINGNLKKGWNLIQNLEGEIYVS